MYENDVSVERLPCPRFNEFVQQSRAYHGAHVALTITVGVVASTKGTENVELTALVKVEREPPTSRPPQERHKVGENGGRVGSACGRECKTTWVIHFVKDFAGSIGSTRGISINVQALWLPKRSP
jgi:hypothetical protein